MYCRRARLACLHGTFQASKGLQCCNVLTKPSCKACAQEAVRCQQKGMQRGNVVKANSQSRTNLAISGSNPGMMWGMASTKVTSDPRAVYTSENSSPM